MKRLMGGRTATLTAELTLLASAERKKWTRSPIVLNFEVPLACSGLEVNYLKVLERKLGYDESQVTRLVRYISRSGSYEVRY